MAIRRIAHRHIPSPGLYTVWSHSSKQPPCRSPQHHRWIYLASLQISSAPKMDMHGILVKDAVFYGVAWDNPSENIIEFNKLTLHKACLTICAHTHTHTFLYISVCRQHCIGVCVCRACSSSGWGSFLHLTRLLGCMDPALCLSLWMRRLVPALGQALCLMSLVSHDAAILDLALVHGEESPLVHQVTSSSNQHKEEKHLHTA